MVSNSGNGGEWNEGEVAANSAQQYKLTLYVSGLTGSATRAIRNIRRICEENLSGHYDLEIVDVYQQPGLAKDEQILAAPTLIKHFPMPLRRLIGDMSDKDRVLLGLGIKPGQSH